MVIAEIHPPVMPSAWWLALGAGLLLVGAAVVARGVWKWRRLGRLDDVSLGELEALQAETLDAIDAALRDGTVEAGARRISLAVRRFVGLAGDTQADYQSSEQLRFAARLDPRLVPVAELVDDLQPMAFGRRHDEEAPARLRSFARQAKEVVQQWR